MNRYCTTAIDNESQAPTRRIRNGKDERLLVLQNKVDPATLS